MVSLLGLHICEDCLILSQVELSVLYLRSVWGYSLGFLCVIYIFVMFQQGG